MFEIRYYFSYVDFCNSLKLFVLFGNSVFDECAALQNSVFDVILFKGEKLPQYKTPRSLCDIPRGEEPEGLARTETPAIPKAAQLSPLGFFPPLLTVGEAELWGKTGSG